MHARPTCAGHWHAGVGDHSNASPDGGQMARLGQAFPVLGANFWFSGPRVRLCTVDGTMGS